MTFPEDRNMYAFVGASLGQRGCAELTTCPQSLDDKELWFELATWVMSRSQ